jgi:hypothetical protein
MAEMGFEPIRPIRTGDFKSPASAFPPLGRNFRIAYRVLSFPRKRESTFLSHACPERSRVDAGRTTRYANVYSGILQIVSQKDASKKIKNAFFAFCNVILIFDF